MLDIIVVNYNTKHLMDPVIDSIYAWTPPNSFNLYRVDNGSNDGSIELLEEKQKKLGFNLIKLSGNNGVGRAVNTAIIASAKQGNDVVLVHSDIEIQSHWMEDMVNCMTEGVGAVEAKVQLTDKYINKGGSLWATPRFEFAGTAFLLLRRDMLTEIGCFSTEFFQSEDMDFWVRLHASGWKIGYCKTTKIVHHASGTRNGVLNDLTNGNILTNEAAKKFNEKYHEKYLATHWHPLGNIKASQPLD
jgi:GT2 family glycosyltransferase